MSVEPDTTIGFVGLGNMGGAIARRLLTQGRQVVGFDLNSETVASFVQSGGQAALSPVDVADRAKLVFASLPSVAASDAVALGASGVVHGKSIEIYVETSTIGTAAIKRLATQLQSRGVAVLDAPVTGAVMAAQAGTLTTMVAGPKLAFDQAEPVWRDVASNIFYVGEQPGLGQLYKLVNNYMAMAGMVAACEAVALGASMGVDESQILEVVNHGSGQSWVTTVLFPSIILPRIKTGARLAIGLKDLELYLGQAAELGMDSDFAKSLFATFSRVIDQDASSDWISLYDYMRRSHAATTQSLST
jgi:3-hydroxyisobutyrate dehydrogenase-like beta-hydroxyacid dehydrogenase